MVAVNLYQSARNWETGSRVRSALLNYDEVRFGRVSANAFCGIVELLGKVSTELDRVTAIQIAERVPGVSTVVDSIEIRSVPPRQSADSAPRSHFNSQAFVRGHGREF